MNGFEIHLRSTSALVTALLLATVGTLVAAPPAVATNVGDTLVSVGSPITPFRPNRQVEPAVAVDPIHTNILVAGAIDNIDTSPCGAGDPTQCRYTPDVGALGVYFSFDAGETWTQPTYTGLTVRGCAVPGPDCTPVLGPTGTLPWYTEADLSSNGDPALVFGPRRGPNGTFSWTNGSRLYYSGMAFNEGSDGDPTGYPATTRGPLVTAVSRTDDLEGAASGDKNAWLPPVIVSKQSSTTVADKDQIWADNAASSPYFGNVYVCWADFRSDSQGNAFPEPLKVATSTDGGDSWTLKQLTSAANNSKTQQGWGRSGCTIRTDSHGVVYLLAVQGSGEVGHDLLRAHILFKSFDGGSTWTKPVALFNLTSPCARFSPVSGSCVEDGVAGARAIGYIPSLDIANGAPTGADATNVVVDAYVDAVDGLNHEHVTVRYSTNGTDWSAPLNVEARGDRGLMAAPALSPNGTDLYVVYDGLTTPFQETTATARGLVGVMLHADVGLSGPTNWSVLHRGQVGDPRAGTYYTLQYAWVGDYVSAAATRTYGAGVWNDARRGAACDAVNAYRQATNDGVPATSPAIQTDCPPGFGNTDIYGGSYADPTP